MTITYKNRLSDLWRFSIYNYLRGRSFLIINGLLIIWFSYQLLRAGAGLNETVLVKALTFVTMLVLILASLNLLSMLTVLLCYVPKLNRAILTSHTVTLNDSGVAAETGTSRAETRWSGVLKVRQNRSFIYLYCAEHAAHVIPKRAFASPDDAVRFFQFARQAHDASQAA